MPEQNAKTSRPWIWIIVIAVILLLIIFKGPCPPGKPVPGARSAGGCAIIHEPSP
jgi:hypothetical protein